VNSSIEYSQDFQVPDLFSEALLLIYYSLQPVNSFIRTLEDGRSKHKRCTFSFKKPLEACPGARQQRVTRQRLGGDKVRLHSQGCKAISSPFFFFFLALFLPFFLPWELKGKLCSYNMCALRNYDYKITYLKVIFGIRTDDVLSRSNAFA